MPRKKKDIPQAERDKQVILLKKKINDPKYINTAINWLATHLASKIHPYY